MKRKNRLFAMLLTVLLSALMITPVFAKEKSGVDDGAVRRSIEEVQGKCGVDDGAVRRTVEEVQGKCGVDDGAVRRTVEEMKLNSNSGLTDAQKFYVGIMAGLTIITVALSLYIIYGKDKKIDE